MGKNLIKKVKDILIIMSKISISREESLEKMIQMPWRSMVNIYIWRINGLDMYWKKCNGQNAREQQEQSNHHLNFKPRSDSHFREQHLPHFIITGFKFRSNAIELCFSRKSTFSFKGVKNERSEECLIKGRQQELVRLP